MLVKTAVNYCKMEKREKALSEALIKNAEETVRWEGYQKENEQAIKNLEMFSKNLAVDVMVPIGRKAFTRGQLIHTNEVLVGHYQNYFSKCSAYTAKEICNRRIEMAKTRLGELKIEAEMWQNKLEKPYIEGVIPTEGQHEIIEDYNEQEERWRAEHKKRAKAAKLRENEEWRREILNKDVELEYSDVKQNEFVGDKENTDADILSMLEQAELMEEFEKELYNLEIEGSSEEILTKLMSGEMVLPASKARVAHSPSDIGKEIQVNKSPTLQGVIKKTALPLQTSPTNNNIRVNPEIVQNSISDNYDGNDSDGSETPSEVKVIEEQAKFLSSTDQIGFYEYQLQIIGQKLRNCAVSSEESIEEKLHLIKVHSHLEELLEDAVDADELAALEASNDNEKEIEIDDHQKKRRISFANEDHTLEFRKNETVAQMLPKLEKEPNDRDIIRLDDDKTIQNTATKPLPALDKKQMILNKVKENLQYVSEHQTEQDFDLINKIINTDASISHTLHISFKHSTQTSNIDLVKDTKDEVNPILLPGTPADLYRLVFPTKKQQPTALFFDAYAGEDKVKTSILKEEDRKNSYRDMRVEFSRPKSIDISNSVFDAEDVKSTKSILRNKNAVESETHLLDNNTHSQSNKENVNKKQKKKRKTVQPLNEDEYMSAYYKVMHDVIEKPLTDPEPLPAGNFIDAHAPKKRISRFKQLRTVTDKT